MKYILAAFILISQSIRAQQLSKADIKVTEELRASINYLADDKLEGRRTGSAGEKLAYEFIVKEFQKAGLVGLTSSKSFLQPFDVYEGKEINKETSVILGGKLKQLYRDFFPFPYSANVKNLTIDDENDIAYYDIENIKRQNENNPHFDIKDDILNFSKKALSEGKKSVIVKDKAQRIAQEKQNEFSFDGKDKTPAIGIPVIYLIEQPTGNAAVEAIPALTPAALISVSLIPKVRTGHNVIGYINNSAPHTIILGAHYDHLGNGEDHNSLHAGKTPMIHNGADDNASGTAALIELGKWLKKSAHKKYNYVLIAFSGEELGLYGSKYFTEHPGIDLKTVNYMINMDMIGRLNDSTHGLTIGGYGTSPYWSKLINTNDTYFKINLDSSGSGPSDHTSFYRKDIPVLFFFTGSHKDYHKPSDDAEKINYRGELKIIHYIQDIIARTNKMDKLSFTKTREVSMGKSSFKVSMGIMPDYTYSGSGVMVDGVSENKAAQKAGVKTGDVLTQLGDHKFTDVQTYMDALNKFNKGESTNVKLKRGKEELILPVTF